ncbi:hypothetical protein EG327_000153 [Venturia inaequalis]|uniref:Uncharacterized protein n=1 Tax=Venturia inaequalis TaxID=5025 RepID=A0A8H3VPR1_VENIN|nr:hypothetical protein EG327_000153 [Venturia inaequalis]
MKSCNILLALPLTASAAVMKIGPRQFDMANLAGSLVNALGPKPVKAAKIQELTPRNPDAKRIRITWGPYMIRGTNSTSKLGNSPSMDGGGTGYQFRTDTDFPTDITLLDGIVEIHNKEGKRLTLEENVYTHHFLMYDMGKPQKPTFSCENNQKIRYVPMPGSVIMGGAAEDAEAHYSTTTVMAGKKTGYYAKKDTPIIANIDIVNSKKEDMEVYPSADMEFIPGRPEGYLDASPVFLPVTGCDTKDLVPGIVQTPKGATKWQLNSKGVVANEDAILFVFRGHMHDGGEYIDLKVNDELACNSLAVYGGKGHVGKNADGKVWETIGDMKTCPEGVVVKKGDRISMSASYDLAAHPAREGGHGGMLGDGLGKLMGGDTGHAEQMAVMIVYAAPLSGK